MGNDEIITESRDSVKRICCGIDIHRDFACVSVIERSAQGDTELDYQKFSTTKPQMLGMRDWLLSLGVTVAGIESTGKFWFSVFNALEGDIKLNVYNARHIKNLPGKKTDKSDSRWIAKVTLDETIKPSFIPNAQIRDARMLARYRKSLVQERTRVRQQTHGVLESAGIKISGQVSDLFGTSGRNLLRLIVEEIPYNELIIERSVRNQVRKKVPALMLAMDGYIRPNQISILKKLLANNDIFTHQIQNIEQELREMLLDTPEKIEIFERVKSLPGFSDNSALILLAETGFDLSAFPTIKHFSSWAGMSPGSHESAGKNRSGKIQNRQKYLRSLLIEIALVAVTKRNTYLRAKYFNLKLRIGANKAVVAIAHKLIKAVYLAVKENKPYHELTGEYVSISQFARDKRKLEQITARLGGEAVAALLDSIAKASEETQ